MGTIAPSFRWGFFMPKLFEIFKAGTHTDNHGKRVTITEADLSAAAEAYNTAAHEAPIVVGHPTTNAPAYGWVGRLKAEGGSLLADFAQVDKGFADLVRAGRYKKVSASFYTPDAPANPAPGRWSLRHVGFLGAHPPAVKGLKPIEFNEAEDGVASFGEDSPPAAPENPTDHENHEPNKETDMSPEEQLAAEKAAREKAEAEAAQAKAELKKLQDEQEQDLRDAAHKQNADFAEGLVKEGRLKPADKDLLVQALDFCEHPEHYTADFGEAGSKKPLAQALRDFMAAVLPKQLPDGGHWAKSRPSVRPAGVSAEFAEAADPEAMSHHERALALAAKEGISYAEAARRTVSE